METLSSILYEDDSFMSCPNDEQDPILSNLSVEKGNKEIQKLTQNQLQKKNQTDLRKQTDLISGQHNQEEIMKKTQEEISENEIFPEEESKTNLESESDLRVKKENDMRRNTKIKYYKTTIICPQEISLQVNTEQNSIDEFFQDIPLESKSDSYIHPRIQKSQSLLKQKQIIQKQIDEIQEKQNENARKQGEERDQQTNKIFQYVEEFSIGTFKYEEDPEAKNKAQKIQKKYIPIFPHFYLNKHQNIDLYKNEINFNSCENFSISEVECNFFNKNLKRFNQQSNFQSNDQDRYRLPTQLQIKFKIQNSTLKRETQDYQDQLTKMKEACERKGLSFKETQVEQKSRLFQIDISLQVHKNNLNHQPKIYYDYERRPDGEILEDGQFYFIIDLSNPCEVLEQLPKAKGTQFQKILSPFRHTNDLLNYWNLKQVIFIKGRKRQQFDLKPFLRKLIDYEHIQQQTANIFNSKNYNFDLVRYEYNPHSKKLMIPNQFKLLEQEIKFLQDHIIKFKERIENLAFPLRLSIMVLISNRKVQIFDENIIDLIDQLLSEKFTIEKQQDLLIQQIQMFWENQDDPQNFKYKSYQIAIEALAKKTGWLEIERPLKKNELFQLVIKYLETRDVISKNLLIKQECQDYIEDPNRLPQRRIWVTPTVKIVRPMDIDQSNPVLREIKYLIEYMTRINILSDYQQQEWFNNDRNEPLLKSFVEPVIREINICGINFKYLNHSASQIKQKSWWQYTDNHGFKVQEQAQSSNGRSADKLRTGSNRQGTGSDRQGTGSDRQGTSSDKKNKSDDRQGASSESINKQKINNLISRFQNRDEFLKTIGEFTDKKELKKLAREGQSMSSSTFVLSVNDNQYTMVPDEESNDCNYTDGCGYISPNFMEIIQNHPHFNLSNVSAIQMRCFGFKGVLVSHPSLQDNQIQIVFRNSMQKFKGEINQLSVIRCATFSPGFLNRQVILLLDYLGVPQEILIERNKRIIQNLDITATLSRLYQQARNIKKLKDLESQHYNSAKQLLEEIRLYFGPSRQFKNIFVRALLVSQSFIKHKDNRERYQFSLSHEPIFEQILSNMVLGQAQLLKKKQRIRVKDSAVLIGVCDILNLEDANQNFPEDSMLSENEIFCQIQVETTLMKEEKSRMRSIFKKNFKLNDGNCKILQKEMIEPEIQLVEGEVLLTKNPCGHKGDIRRVKCIGKDHPAYKKLSHLVNVIVFPAKGSRPLQNMMSGGDLDGDVYMIIWDQEIVNSIKLKEWPPAAQYDDENLQNDYTVELSGSKDFAASIADYFQRDLLGKMSNIHLSLAISEGVDNPETEKAAYLCSIQVDFAKHGRCIKLDQFSELKRLVEKKGRPRFLIDDRDDPYESEMPIIVDPEKEHIIQKLYDMVDINQLHENCLRIEHKYAVMLDYTVSDFFINLNFNSSKDDEGIVDIINFACLVPYFQEMFEKVVWPMEQKLKQIMMKFKIVNEGELFCSDFQYKFIDEKQSDFIGAVSNSNEDTKNEINRQLDILISEYRKIFQNLAEALASKTYDETNKQFGPARLIALLNNESIQIPQKTYKTLPHYIEFVKQQLAKAIYYVSYFDLKNKNIEDGITRFKNSLDNKHKFQQANFREEKKQILNQLNEFVIERAQSQTQWIYDNCPRMDEDDAERGDQRSLNLGYEQILDEIHDEDQANKLRKEFLLAEELRLELLNFDKYIKVCKRAAADNEDRISYLWTFKKVFTTPWLICYDYLLV